MSGVLAYIPFVTPLPVWNYWVWLLIPLCLAVSVVYKSIKCWRINEIPREALVLTLWIIVSMIGVALGVLAVYRVFLSV